MDVAFSPEETEKARVEIDCRVSTVMARDGGKTLDDLERLRIKNLRLFQLGCSGFCIFVTLSLVSIFLPFWIRKTHGLDIAPTTISLLGNGCVLMAALAGGLAGVAVWTYRTTAGQTLMPALLSLFGDLTSKGYVGEDDALAKRLAGSNLVHHFDRLVVTNLFDGTMQGVDVSFATIEIVIDPGNLNYDHGRYPQILLECHLPSPVSFWLVMSPKRKQVGTMFAPLIEKFEVENPAPDFEKVFVAYSDDQVLARTFLTPDVIERLTELKSFYGNRELGISLRDNSLIILANRIDDFEQASLSVSAHDLARANDAGRQVCALSMLVQTLATDWKLAPATPSDSNQTRR